MMKGPGSATMRSGAINRTAGKGSGEEKFSGPHGMAVPRDCREGSEA